MAGAKHARRAACAARPPHPALPPSYRGGEGNVFCLFSLPAPRTAEARDFVNNLLELSNDLIGIHSPPAQIAGNEVYFV